MHAFSMQNIAAMLCGIHLCALCLCLYLADHYLMLCDDVQYVQPLTDCLTPEALPCKRRVAICLVQLLGMLLTANSHAHMRSLLCLSRQCQMACGCVYAHLASHLSAVIGCTFALHFVCYLVHALTCALSKHVIHGVLQADQQDTPCSLDRYSCLSEVLQYALPSAAPSMPGIRCHSIAQAGRHPPGAPTRKLPSNMWDSAFVADNKHLSSRWSVQLHEIRNPLIADPITSTNGLLLRLESARTGSLSSRALDSASSAYTGTPTSLYNSSSRPPMQPCYIEVPSSAQDSFVGRQKYSSHRSSCLAQISRSSCLLA